MKSKDGSDDPTLPNMVTRSSDPSLAGPLEVGYEIRELLGRGGMGEVLLAHDPQIGREVALKRMSSGEPNDEAIARFQREAKIQARLDHPAIVPVHEIGRDAQGRPFFTMKRLTGTTLANMLANETATLQKLLRAFVDVCLAVELAHSKRIVHRDLKPANIMLGDYGEVYVLDWGVARVLDRDTTESNPTIPSLDTEGTQAGKLLGTPGYMAPEQIRGADVGPSADVYALGAILFELLAGEPLHPRGIAALTTTLERPTASPIRRQPTRTIAPELDAACSAALAAEPAARPSARELGDRIQRYLDGDRDLEQRRTLAAEELATARTALVDNDRAAAVYHAGRAVALDPSSSAATALLTTLIVEPPPEIPPALQKTLAAEEEAMRRERSRRAVIPFLAFFGIIPFLPAFEILSWPLLIAEFASFTGMALVSFINWRVRAVPLWLFLGAQLAMVFMFSRIAGPLMLTPGVIAGMLLSSTSIAWLNDHKWAVIGWTLLATVLPFVLESVGLFAPTWDARPEGMLTHGTLFGSQSAALVNAWTIIASNVAVTLLLASYALAIARDRRIAQHKLSVQAWHLQQLLPH
jgi:serine/threonine-protein kinase